MKKLNIFFIALLSINFLHPAEGGGFGEDLDLKKALEESIEAAEGIDPLQFFEVESRDRMKALIREYETIDKKIHKDVAEAMKALTFDTKEYRKLVETHDDFGSRLWLCRCVPDENRITLSQQIVKRIIEEYPNPANTSLTYFSLGSGELLQDALILTELVLLGYSLDIYLRDPLLNEKHVELLKKLLISHKKEDQSVTVNPKEQTSAEFIATHPTIDMVIAIDPDPGNTKRMREAFDQMESYLTPETGIAVWAINSCRVPGLLGQSGMTYFINGTEYRLKKPMICYPVTSSSQKPPQSKPKEKGKKPKKGLR